MVLVINQPNYIPWKGYFDLIDRADLFIWYDDVQYTVNDWRNRNKIKTPYGTKWITVPVDNSIHKLINETNIIYNNNWIRKQLKLFYDSYRKCPFFQDAYALLEEHLSKRYGTISDLNINLNESICRYLGIQTNFIVSSRYHSLGNREERIINMCKYFNAKIYLSGPSASNYITPAFFKKEGVKLAYIDYNYNTYDQPHGEFDHYVSILDTIACLGKETINYIRKSGVSLKYA